MLKTSTHVCISGISGVFRCEVNSTTYFVRPSVITVGSMRAYGIHFRPVSSQEKNFLSESDIYIYIYLYIIIFS